MQLICSEYSGIGQRANQQDYFGKFIKEQDAIFVVADGMGGRKGGSIASEIAVKTILDRYVSFKNGNIIDAIRDSIYLAHQKIQSFGTENPEIAGMGTTVVVLYINKEFAYSFHVGDSRLYQTREELVVFKTKDHSKVSEMIENSILDEEEARVHQDSNVLTQALGASGQLKITESGFLPYLKFDNFLLCTDGVWGSMNQNKLIDFMGEFDQDPKQFNLNTQSYITQLSALPNNTKRQDNFTSIIIKTMTNSNMKVNVSILERIKRYQVALILFGILALFQIWGAFKFKNINKQLKAFIIQDSVFSKSLDSNIFELENKLSNIENNYQEMEKKEKVLKQEKETNSLKEKSINGNGNSKQTKVKTKEPLSNVIKESKKTKELTDTNKTKLKINK